MASGLQGCSLQEIVIHPENPYYKTDGQTVFSGDNNKTLYYLSPKKQGEYIVPSFVTRIGQSAFRGGKLSKLIMGDQITFIDTFCLCGNTISEIILPSYITTIPDGMFWGCWRLSSINLPDSITQIGTYAFISCSGLSNTQLPNRLTTLGNNVFESCSSLRKITLPKNLINIGSGVFQGIKQINITSLNPDIFVDGFQMYKDRNQTLFTYLGVDSDYDVTVLGSCTSISSGTFSSKQLRNVYFSSNINISFGDDSFRFSSVKSIIFPPGLKNLGYRSFGNCDGLSSVTFQGNQITTIPELCFESCQSLSDITLQNQ